MAILNQRLNTLESLLYTYSTTYMPMYVYEFINTSAIAQLTPVLLSTTVMSAITTNTKKITNSILNNNFPVEAQKQLILPRDVCIKFASHINHSYFATPTLMSFYMCKGNLIFLLTYL